MKSQKEVWNWKLVVGGQVVLAQFKTSFCWLSAHNSGTFRSEWEKPFACNEKNCSGGMGKPCLNSILNARASKCCCEAGNIFCKCILHLLMSHMQPLHFLWPIYFKKSSKNCIILVKSFKVVGVLTLTSWYELWSWCGWW